MPHKEVRKKQSHWYQILTIAFKRFFKEKYTYKASALSFTTLLALVPMLSVLLSLISIFPVFTRFIQLTQNYIFANFIPTSSNVIQYYLEGFVQKASHLPIIGLLFLFFVAAMLIVTIKHTLNEIWRVPARSKKLLSWLLYWLLLLIMPLFIGLSIFSSSYVFSLLWFSHAGVKFSIGIYLLSIFPLVMNTLIFSIIYIIVPSCKVSWRDGFIGGCVAAILFEIAKKGFAFYILHFASYELIYGVLAAVPIFLLWIYVSWVIVLLGALVAYTHYERRLS